MKKRTIWTIAIVTGAILLALLYLQTLYFREVLEICTEQFDLQSQRSLRKVAREVDEDLRIRPDYEEMSLQERVKLGKYDSRLRQALSDNGIDLAYHFTISTTDGRQIYNCPDYVGAGGGKVYTQELFIHSPKPQMGVLYLHFPERNKYIISSQHYMVPVVALIFLIFIIFVLTIWATFRQKRVSEIKNDFINNMTHELKTPISSISLAAQMLGDSTLPKTEGILAHLSSVIVDETKRLRFLVDRVLQMSMFDEHQRPQTFHPKELDINLLASEVVDTFRLKVESTGGHIDTQLHAEESLILGDEMHLTNVIFNLLDNAVKYRSNDRDLTLSVSTHNEGDHIILTITDNGIGISKDDLRKVFDKFYRVSTGNRHDVKGFGLGLAYVRSVVVCHKGHIHAESEMGQGTRFVISLPMIAD